MQCLRRFAAPTVSRAFSTTAPCLRVGPLMVFMKKVASRPELKPLSIGDRGRLVGHWWKKLPEAQKQAIRAEAEKMPFPKKKAKKAAAKLTTQQLNAKKIGMTAYHKFVIAQCKLPDIQKLDKITRMKTIGKRWSALHPKKAAPKVKRAPAKKKAVKKAAAPKAAAPKAAPAKKAAATKAAKPAKAGGLDLAPPPSSIKAKKVAKK